VTAWIARADELIARLTAFDRPRIVVVGGGAGGVELAFALRARLEREGVPGAQLTLLERAPTLLPGYPRSTVRRVAGSARARAIELYCGAAVVDAGPRPARLEGGERRDGDGPA